MVVGICVDKDLVDGRTDGGGDICVDEGLVDGWTDGGGDMCR